MCRIGTCSNTAIVIVEINGVEIAVCGDHIPPNAETLPIGQEF